MSVSFAVISENQYLQGMMINDTYNKTGKGGTMSTAFSAHTLSEFTPVFSSKIKYFDSRTLKGYLDVILESIRFGELDLHELKISVLKDGEPHA